MTVLARCRCGPPPGFSAKAVTVGDAARSQRLDPTGTLDVRSAFAGQMDKRWSALKRVIIEAIDRNDVLGLNANRAQFSAHAQGFNLQPFAGGDKVKAFQSWIDAALQQVILGGDGSWMAPYLRTSADRAQTRAAKLLGRIVGRDGEQVGAVTSLAAVELQGIMEAVSQKAVRALADGHLSKQRASRVARDIATVITDTGRKRGRDLAQTIVVKMFATATVDAFKAAGVRKVGTTPERIRVAKGPHGLAIARDEGPPDEERDDRGRWTSSGSGSSSEQPTDKELIGAAADMKTGEAWNGTLYRGTGSSEARVASQYASGEHWSPNEAHAATYGSDVHSEMILIKNPMVFDLPGKKAYFNELKDRFGTSDPKEITRSLEAKGHDALVVRNVPINRSGIAGRGAEIILFKARINKFNKVGRDAECQPGVFIGRCRVGDAKSKRKAPSARKQREIEKQAAELAKLDEVDVLTAGDDDVCQVCEDISNEGPYDINEALSIIPAHPNCRCAFIPVSDERFAEVAKESD